MNELDETRLALADSLRRKFQLALQVLLLQQQVDRLVRAHTEAWNTIAEKDETIHEQASRIRELEKLCRLSSAVIGTEIRRARELGGQVKDLKGELAATQHLVDREISARLELAGECADLAAGNARLRQIVGACTEAMKRQALFIEAMSHEAGDLQARIGEIVAD